MPVTVISPWAEADPNTIHSDGDIDYIQEIEPVYYVVANRPHRQLAHRDNMLNAKMNELITLANATEDALATIVLNDITDCNVSGASANQALVFNGASWVPMAILGENVGSGAQVYYGRNGTNIQMRAISGSGMVTTTTSGSSVVVSASVAVGSGLGGNGTPSNPLYVQDSGGGGITFSGYNPAVGPYEYWQIIGSGGISVEIQNLTPGFMGNLIIDGSGISAGTGDGGVTIRSAGFTIGTGVTDLNFVNGNVSVSGSVANITDSGGTGGATVVSGTADFHRNSDLQGLGMHSAGIHSTYLSNWAGSAIKLHSNWLDCTVDINFSYEVGTAGSGILLSGRGTAHLAKYDCAGGFTTAITEAGLTYYSGIRLFPSQGGVFYWLREDDGVPHPHSMYCHQHGADFIFSMAQDNWVTGSTGITLALGFDSATRNLMMVVDNKTAAFSNIIVSGTVIQRWTV